MLKLACVAGVATGLLIYQRVRQRNQEPKETLEPPPLWLVNDKDERIPCGPLHAIQVKTQHARRKKHPVVFVHGMWHSSWHFRGLQELLAADGFDSYALELEPGLFKSMSAHVRDLKQAISSLNLQNPILVGHSQGGIILQHYMHTVNNALDSTRQAHAVVLLGTAAIGKLKLMALTTFSLLRAAGLWRYMMTGMTGHVPNVETMKAFFTLKETESTTVTGKRISLGSLFTLVKATPRDGWPTYVSHCLASRWVFKSPPKFEVPSLVVHFEQDRCYPVEHADWLVKTYESKLLTVDGLAHCFLDEGWELCFAKPLRKWFNKVCDST